MKRIFISKSRMIDTTWRHKSTRILGGDINDLHVIYSLAPQNTSIYTGWSWNHVNSFSSSIPTVMPSTSHGCISFRYTHFYPYRLFNPILGSFSKFVFRLSSFSMLYNGSSLVSCVPMDPGWKMISSLLEVLSMNVTIFSYW